MQKSNVSPSGSQAILLAMNDLERSSHTRQRLATGRRMGQGLYHNAPVMARSGAAIARWSGVVICSLAILAACSLTLANGQLLARK